MQTKLQNIERWMPIKGFEGLYEISDHGIVKTFHDRHYSHVLGIKQPGLAADGYHQVQLTRKNKTRSCLYVHRLVGLHFIPNPDGKPKINHKDGNKLNNHYLNLEWCTQLENIHHAHRTGLVRKSNINPAKKDEIKALKASGKSLIELGKMFSMHPCSISRLINKKAASTENA
jgi:hypothetical protein